MTGRFTFVGIGLVCISCMLFSCVSSKENYDLYDKKIYVIDGVIKFEILNNTKNSFCLDKNFYQNFFLSDTEGGENISFYWGDTDYKEVGEGESFVLEYVAPDSFTYEGDVFYSFNGHVYGCDVRNIHSITRGELERSHPNFYHVHTYSFNGKFESLGF